MPTIKDIIMAIEVEQEQTSKRYERATAEINNILAKAKNEGRANLTTDEDRDIDQAFITRDSARSDLKGIENKMARAKKIEAEEAETDLALRERGADPKPLPGSKPGTSKPAYDRVARVGQEERTYHPGVDRNGGSFIRDVTKQYLYRDLEAEQRLIRHMQEERVERSQYLQRTAAGTGQFVGLTVPQYLTEMYAPKVAALRPFADACNHHDLPVDGMNINISLIATGTNAQIQATQNTAISPDSSIADTLLTENVQTVAGQQTLSRQAIDRATGVEDIVMDDLFRRYVTALDSTLINQATTGLAAISTAQAQATVLTTPQLYSAIVQAASSVETTLLGWAQPDLVVMHPRRWYKLLSAVSSTWPMALGGNNNVPTQNLLVNNDALGYAKGIRGTLQNGLAVCVDANVTTAGLAQATTGGTQDQMYVVPSQECHLWEDPAAPVFIRAEQPAAANLGVLLVMYGYFAYTFRRFPGATINLCGAAFVPPAFDGT